MLARAEVGEPTAPKPNCYRTEKESINLFTRYIADTRYILDQPSLSLVIVRVREKAVNPAILDLRRNSTAPLQTLHEAGIPPLIFTNEWRRVSDMIDDFLGGNNITDNQNKEPNTSKLGLAAVETRGIYIAEQHDAHDQLPMLGGMRRLWQHAWFTDPQQNAFAKVLNIDLEQFPVDSSIDTNTTMSAPHRPKYISEHRIGVDEGQSELDADKITRPTLLIRLPVPSN
ncbi:hypothetical protein Cob_v010206 [Colletotrichum orbiculare MAFF 240422]|uniref:Uncharacterized protein n=1 Tax=Colletotrichum orbiculare (strain 104-T / ATCC 96160 / CBS 514.97 / LARS 414 / MAFF 240422) TaxID=1213857 RepID=A0A484FG98_COLOR|nr:hypothetical protein Cob_v010206 [Colletotrichum orbiculare MAFF 240422]